MIDKTKLTDHLEACIELTKDEKVAVVLTNLKKEIESGQFDEED